MWTFIASAGALAFTGGLALACFVKAFGATFLARPRSEEVKHAKESSFSLRFGMGALALSTIVFGVFSGGVTTALQAIASALIGATDKSPIFIHVSRFEQISTGNFASSSGLVLFMILALVLGFVWFVTKFGIYKNQKIRIGETWDCGTDLKPRMEITSTGFARSIIVIFKNVLRPSLQHNIEYDDSSSRYLPKRTVTLSIHDIYRTYLYNPIQKVVTILSERTKVIQSGNLNMYILYIFVALLAALYIAH
jgi:hydrogenase-4 component B